jgi:hypothetical protein
VHRVAGGEPFNEQEVAIEDAELGVWPTTVRRFPDAASLRPAATSWAGSGDEIPPTDADADGENRWGAVVRTLSRARLAGPGAGGPTLLLIFSVTLGG